MVRRARRCLSCQRWRQIAWKAWARRSGQHNRACQHRRQGRVSVRQPVQCCQHVWLALACAVSAQCRVKSSSFRPKCLLPPRWQSATRWELTWGRSRKSASFSHAFVLSLVHATRLRICIEVCNVCVRLPALADKYFLLCDVLGRNIVMSTAWKSLCFV